MTYHQLAMSRVRAVEHNVPVLVAATSGVSAVIGKDGSVRQESGIFGAATLTAELVLGDAGTLATRIGGHVETVLSALGIVAVGVVPVLGKIRPRVSGGACPED